jgi:hypothetical protein
MLAPQVGTDHFVTVEMYIILPSALIAALLLQAAATQQALDAGLGAAPDLQQLAANRGRWVASAKLVAAVFALCSCAGWLARQVGAAACCSAAGQRWPAGGGAGSGAVALLAVLAGWQVAASLRAARAAGGGGAPAAAAPNWQQVKVLQLSITAAQLAAMACINWALAYATCLAVLPLSCCCSWAPQQQQQHLEGAASGEGSIQGLPAQAAKQRARLRRAQACSRAAVLLWAPPLVLAAVWLLSGNRAGLLLAADTWWWLLLESRITTYMMCWAVYLPAWSVALLVGGGGAV